MKTSPAFCIGMSSFSVNFSTAIIDEKKVYTEDSSRKGRGRRKQGFETIVPDCTGNRGALHKVDKLNRKKSRAVAACCFPAFRDLAES